VLHEHTTGLRPPNGASQCSLGQVGPPESAVPPAVDFRGPHSGRDPEPVCRALRLRR
jgi:hypothetical protein